MLDKLVTASLSDVGRSRSDNQDACREASSSLGERLLVLADGMGGHRGGAEASRMCVQTIERRFLEPHDSVEVRLRRGLEEANAEILQRGLENTELAGMGATCVALALCPDGQGWVAWAGDSRLYRLRDGALEQLTEDHSLVCEWQKLGVLTAAQAANHPKRNELTRAIGVTREVEPEFRTLELRAGDRYLLCSDGLSAPVEAATLQQILESCEPDAAARALVDAANARGGPDNVTVQIAWLPGDPPHARATRATEPTAPAARPIEPRGQPAPREEPAFELPARPAPLAPLASRAAGFDALSATPPGRTAERVRPRLHMPSLVAGVGLGLALALAATGYLRWQRSALPAAASAPAPQPAPPAPPQPAVQPPPSASHPSPAPAASASQAPIAARPAPPPAAPAGQPFVVVGEVPRDGAYHWVPAAEPMPTSAAFDLPAPVHAFLDAWLVALSTDDAAAHAALGFPTSAAEFARAQASRESYRMNEAEVSSRSSPAQVFLRVVLSYAFENGSGRFRTEDELRLILEPGADGLHFAGYWQE
jgi:serine/threonine protein phosphatase PrpC